MTDYFYFQSCEISVPWHANDSLNRKLNSLNRFTSRNSDSRSLQRASFGDTTFPPLRVSFAALPTSQPLGIINKEKKTNFHYLQSILIDNLE